MAKRKRGKSEGGSKLRPIKNYQDDVYLPYIYKAEKGIIYVWEEIPDLTDGDVREALRDLIKIIEGWDISLETAADLTDVSLVFDDEYPIDLLCGAIIDGLISAFQQEGPLSIEDLIGVLKQINYSVGNMNIGMRQQGYLRFVSRFLTSMEDGDPSFMNKVVERVNRFVRGMK
jgi:hypothetical protein